MKIFSIGDNFFKEELEFAFSSPADDCNLSSDTIQMNADEIFEVEMPMET